MERPFGAKELPFSGAELLGQPTSPRVKDCPQLLDRQIATQAQSFKREGGFTERLYRTRTAKRRNSY
jgi:four helix bundle suffix protein